MSREIEAKFRLENPDALRRILTQRGARKLRRDLEVSYILDTPDQRLLSGDCGLRVRRCRDLDGTAPPLVTMTFKGPREDVGVAGLANLKSRDEFETTVGDSDQLLTLLERLGFTPRIVFEKRRETWRAGDCTITLDELPLLGWFAEIEAPSAGAIESMCESLALAPDQGVRETYVEMAATHGHPADDGVQRLCFTENSDADL